jgi:hypothetical protein
MISTEESVMVLQTIRFDRSQSFLYATMRERDHQVNKCYQPDGFKHRLKKHNDSRASY